MPPTQCPDKIILRPRSQHGQIEVDDLDVEGRGRNKRVIDDMLHWDHLEKRQVDCQREATRDQLPDDIVLW